MVEVESPHYGNLAELNKNNVSRYYQQCENTAVNIRGDYCFSRYCPSLSRHNRNYYYEFQKSKDLFFRRNTF